MKRRKQDLINQAMTALIELCHETSELCKLARVAMDTKDPELIRQGEQRILQLEEHNRRFEKQLKDM